MSSTTVTSRYVDWFHLPVGYTHADSENRPRRTDVNNWVCNSSPKWLSRQSNGFYLGISALALGLITSIFGFLKENTFTKILGPILAIAGVGAALFAKLFGFEFNLIDHVQTRAVLAPNKKNDISLNELGVDGEEVLITSHKDKSVELHGYFLPSKVKTNKTVIFLNGREHNSSHCVKALSNLQEKVPANVLVVDYRGCGKSKGEANIWSAVDDAEIMYDYLTVSKEEGGRGINPEDVSLYGISFGGAVATQLAKRVKTPLQCLFIQSSFSSLSEISAEVVSNVLKNKHLARAVGWILDPGYDSKEAIKGIKAKHLVISHGTGDRFISKEHGANLCENAKEAGIEVEHIVLPDADHLDFMNFYDENVYGTMRKVFGVE